MLESLILAFFLVAAANMVLSAAAGAAICRRRGLANWVGVVAGAALPWVGLLVPALMNAPGGLPLSRRRPILLGFAPLGLGTLLIFASQFLDWAQVSGSVNTGAQTFTESFEGGVGDSVYGVAMLTGSCLLVLGSGLALWVRPWLGAAVGAVWLSAGALSMALMTTVGSYLVDDTSSLASTYTAGHASASLSLAEGLWSAVLGAVLICLGSVVLVRTVGSSAPLWDSGSAAGLSSTPAPVSAPIAPSESGWGAETPRPNSDPWSVPPGPSQSPATPWAGTPPGCPWEPSTTQPQDPPRSPSSPDGW